MCNCGRQGTSLSKRFSFPSAGLASGTAEPERCERGSFQPRLIQLHQLHSLEGAPHKCGTLLTITVPLSIVISGHWHAPPLQMICKQMQIPGCILGVFYFTYPLPIVVSQLLDAIDSDDSGMYQVGLKCAHRVSVPSKPCCAFFPACCHLLVICFSG